MSSVEFRGDETPEELVNKIRELNTEEKLEVFSAIISFFCNKLDKNPSYFYDDIVTRDCSEFTNSAKARERMTELSSAYTWGQNQHNTDLIDWMEFICGMLWCVLLCGL